MEAVTSVSLYNVIVRCCNCQLVTYLNSPRVVQDKYTPLHLAAQNGHVQVVDTLIKSKADTNAITMVRHYMHNIIMQLYCIVIPHVGKTNSSPHCY